MVNHIDENKLNYNIDNLEWCTQSENSKHSAYKYSKKVVQYNLKTNETIKIFDSIKKASRHPDIQAIQKQQLLTIVKIREYQEVFLDGNITLEMKSNNLLIERIIN